jgi:hypothetical protein
MREKNTHINMSRDLGGKEVKVVSDPKKIKYSNLINISIQSIRTMFKYYLSRLNLKIECISV